MPPAFPSRRPHQRLTPRFGFYLAQRFAVRPQYPNALLPQSLFQHLDFQLRPLQFAL
jgi:hypothetical protein